MLIKHKYDRHLLAVVRGPGSERGLVEDHTFPEKKFGTPPLGKKGQFEYSLYSFSSETW